MKHSISVRFLIILLTAVCLVAAICGCMCIVAMENAGLYYNRLDALQNHEYKSISKSIADNYARLYAANTLGDVPYILKQSLFSDPTGRSDADHWYLVLKQGDEVLSVAGTEQVLNACSAVEQFMIAPLYPIVSSFPPDAKPPMPTTDGLEPDEPVDEPDTPFPVPEDYLYYDQQTNWIGVSFSTYYLYYYQAPEYTVTVYMEEDVLDSSFLNILTLLYPLRYTAIAILVIGLLLFGAGMVYLLWSAGKLPNGDIQPGGLNLIPLDVYGLVSVICIWLLALLFSKIYRWVEIEGPHPGKLSLIIVVLFAITLIAIGFFYAIAAQVKVKGGYWWKHSAIGMLLAKIWQGLRFLWRGCVELCTLLPVIWQWLLIAVLMGSFICTAGLLAMWQTNAAPFLVVTLLICCGIVIYGGYAFGTLMMGAIRMSQGDLDHKIPTKYLIGSFKRFAQQLNTLSETARQAAENEMRSERMKSELITNVSHDIKTPLTSIINFVDLLQKPHDPAQRDEYLDVLSRQSTRMKKLIDDLIELSKANTGNISVNIGTIDACETVNQALGEFSDKLDAVELTPLFEPPQQPVMMLADGRLVWRILSNLLSNAVKYALPGTRLYVDLEQQDEQVLLSLKNISREPLNLQSQELLERFVRADMSRSSEGSGLGLNIAKSLMEVQGGQLQLQVDADLFKVTLIFPAANE